MRIFDVHVHYPGNRPGMQQPRQKPQERVDYLATKLREAGVAKACFLVRDGSADGGVNYKEALKTMKPHNDLFIPVANLNPGTTSPKDLEKLQAMGYRGVKIIGTEKEYDHPDYMPLWAKAEELSMPILFHMGVIGGGLDYAKTHPRRDPEAAVRYQEMMERLKNPPKDGQGFPRRRNVSAIRMRPFHLDTLSANFPLLKIIGAHMGGTGNYDESASVARWRNFVFFDMSGGETIERHSIERGLIGKEIGIEKLVWGSDCGADEILTHVRRFETMFAFLNLTKDQMERLWWRNAAEIYGIEKPVMAKASKKAAASKR